MKTSGFTPVASSRPGIYACGAFTGPKDIPSICYGSQRRGLMPPTAGLGRGTPFLHHRAGYSAGDRPWPSGPQDRGVRVQLRGEHRRHSGCAQGCGIRPRAFQAWSMWKRISSPVPRTPRTKSARSSVKTAMNRVVVAACTPRTHEELFQETLVKAGLNKYLLEMANIRNHDSWVHTKDPEAATEKGQGPCARGGGQGRPFEPAKGCRPQDGSGRPGGGRRRGGNERGAWPGQTGLSRASNRKGRNPGRNCPEAEPQLPGRGSGRIHRVAFGPRWTSTPLSPFT